MPTAASARKSQILGDARGALRGLRFFGGDSALKGVAHAASPLGRVSIGRPALAPPPKPSHGWPRNK